MTQSLTAPAPARTAPPTDLPPNAARAAIRNGRPMAQLATDRLIRVQIAADVQ